MDSRLAGSMKLQVLTTKTSASSAWGTISQPPPASAPSITSLSTRFLGQPRLTIPTLGIVVLVPKMPTLPQLREAEFRSVGANQLRILP